MLGIRFILLCVLFSIFSAKAQSPLEIYVVSEFYNEHKAEADSALQELIDGSVGPVLSRFVNDTVWGSDNKLYIDTIFAAEGFSYANGLDTVPTPGTGPPRYTTQVAYRKISDYNGQGFDWYRLWLGISWNANYDVFARRISFKQTTIRTRQDWVWTMSGYPCPGFLPRKR